MKKWIFITTVAAIVAISAVVFAAPENPRGDDRPRMTRGWQQGPQGLPGPQALRGQLHPGMMLERILANPQAAQRLDLSEDQLASLQDLQLQTARKVIPLRGEAELAQLALREAMGAEMPDLDAIMSAIDQVHKTQAKVQKAEVRSHLAAREIIGEEKLAGIRQGVRERMKGRFGEMDRPDRPRPERPVRPDRPIRPRLEAE